MAVLKEKCRWERLPAMAALIAACLIGNAGSKQQATPGGAPGQSAASISRTAIDLQPRDAAGRPAATIASPRVGLSTVAPVICYLGPETTMPLASALASILGILLAFGRSILRFLRRQWRRRTGRGPRPEDPPRQ